MILHSPAFLRDPQVSIGRHVPDVPLQALANRDGPFLPAGCGIGKPLGRPVFTLATAISASPLPLSSHGRSSPNRAQIFHSFSASARLKPLPGPTPHLSASSDRPLGPDDDIHTPTSPDLATQGNLSFAQPLSQTQSQNLSNLSHG